MINEIDFILTPHATKRLNRVVEFNFGIFDVEWVDENGDIIRHRFDFSSLSIGAVVSDDAPEPIDFISRNASSKGERIRITFKYYYDETGDKPEDTIGEPDGGYRHVKAADALYPVYVLWPDLVAEETLQITDTVQTNNLTNLSDIEITAKQQNVAKWKKKIHALAIHFDNNDNSFKWAQQNSHNQNISSPIPIGSTQAIRLDNTSKHWPKGIGLAWRCVCKYENSNYTTYGTPIVIRTDRTDTTTGTPLNITTGEGINDLILNMQKEYGTESEKNQVRRWFFAAGSVTNIAVWSGNDYFGGMKWGFSDNGSAVYSLYTAADESDWNNLWDEYVKALNYDE